MFFSLCILQTVLLQSDLSAFFHCDKCICWRIVLRKDFSFLLFYLRRLFTKTSRHGIIKMSAKGNSMFDAWWILLPMFDSALFHTFTLNIPIIKWSFDAVFHYRFQWQQLGWYAAVWATYIVNSESRRSIIIITLWLCVYAYTLVIDSHCVAVMTAHSTHSVRSRAQHSSGARRSVMCVCVPELIFMNFLSCRQIDKRATKEVLFGAIFFLLLVCDWRTWQN